MEIGGQLHELEETACYSQIQLAISLSSIDEEIDGEDGFSIGSEETRGDERERGVVLHGILVEEVPEFSCDRQVIFSSSKFVAEADEILESSFIEVVIVSEEEIGTGHTSITFAIVMGVKTAYRCRLRWVWSG